VSSTPTLAHQAEADGIRTLQRALATVDAEHAFDRLNPDFGVPADQLDPAGHHAVQEREAALALGTRTAVALSRENESRPLVRVASQDDRVAAAVRAARMAAERARQGQERTAAER
jgi:hypothetical protein